MRKLKFKCPDCRKSLKPVEAMDHATQIAQRTCSHCFGGKPNTWVIKVVPVKRDFGWVDVGTFTRKAGGDELTEKQEQ